MRILLINNHHVMKGGSERVYFETGKLLEEEGHQVYYFGTGPEETCQLSENYCILPADPITQDGLINKAARAVRFVYSQRNAKALSEFLSRIKPDVAHLHIFYGQLSNSILPVLKRHRIPSVMSVHEYRMLCPAYVMFDRQGSVCQKCAEGNYVHSVVNRCIKGDLIGSLVAGVECAVRDFAFSYYEYIDRFVMVSEFCKQVHLRYKPHLADRSTTLFNFVDLDQFPVKSQDDGYFLFFGRLSREKGVSTFLSAAKTLGLKVKVVGSGELEASLKQEFNECEGIEFLGFRFGDDLKELVRRARFVCVPSEWYENNPMSIIESFAAGTPVIGSNIGGIPELVIDGVNGFLFSAGDEASLVGALRRCLDLSSDQYHELVVNARNFVERNNSKKVHYARLIEIYQELNSLGA